LEPVDCLRQPCQELRFAGQPVERDEVSDVAGRRMRRQGQRLVGARGRGLQIERVLQRPARLLRPLLRYQEEVHAAGDRVQQPLVSQYPVTQDQEVDVFCRNLVVEGQVRRVIRVPGFGELLTQRVALRPAADRVLAFEHELYRLAQRWLVTRVQFLDV